MMQATTINRESAAGANPASDAQNLRGAGNDMEMIKAASSLTRDLNAANPVIYWADFVASALTGYAALFAAIFAPSIWLCLLAAALSILALYRAGSFIHELTHIKRRDVPGFHLAWNIMAGIPLMIPSFMYEGVHNQHHMPKRYGTVQDPEYLPLALMKPYTVPLFVLVAALGPIGLLIRYALLAPLSLAIPPLRRIVVERYSGLVINPEFRRRMPEGEERSRWIALEIATSIWAIGLLTLTATGIIPLAAFLTFLGIASGTMVINQVRTLVAHLWENDGGEMNATQQYLDSVNVPPPATLPALWAPVGLRYHALHHLLPGVPYHNLGEAHRRLIGALPDASSYHGANYAGLPGLVKQLVGSTFKRGQ
ncbi:fatty acid desaturase family protein [Sphingorhabdus arenilitoris]|uniref:Fatty acid desaturase family protein n=1 Tax=Sphingorhabdus arenilitoris TaxID=1490041 RepID=A0ABV8RIR3_9SPHN